MMHSLIIRTKALVSGSGAEKGKPKNITVVKGNIATFQEADVLVNPILNAAGDLSCAGSVSKAFYECGQDELQKMYEEVGPPKQFGTDVTITDSAGLIHARKIFHPAIEAYCNKQSLKLLTRMIKLCLTEAEHFEITSIAFPTVGCGHLRYSADHVAKCFLEASEETVLQVYIVAHTSQLYKTFGKTFRTNEEFGKCEREAIKSSKSVFYIPISTPHSDQTDSPTRPSPPSKQIISLTSLSPLSNPAISPTSPSTPSTPVVHPPIPHPPPSNPVVSPTSPSSPSNPVVHPPIPPPPSRPVVSPTSPSSPSKPVVHPPIPPPPSRPVVSQTSLSTPSTHVVRPPIPPRRSNPVVSPTSPSFPANSSASRTKLVLPKNPYFPTESTGAATIFDDELIEMSIYHSAIANLTPEFICKIQDLESEEVQIHIEFDQSAVTLKGIRKFSIEVKQRILKLLAEDELLGLHKNLHVIKHLRGVKQYLIALAQTKDLGFPDYWPKSTFSDQTKSQFRYHKVVKGSPVFEAVEALIMQTWDDSLVGYGKNAKGLTHTELCITKIQTVENPLLYANYQFRLKALALKAAQKPFSTVSDFLGEPEIKTTQIAGADFLNSRLISEVNEVYLLHGTTRVDGISKNGIDSRLAGDQKLFGRGAYFAESSVKSDQYADRGNKRASVGDPLHMFVARVLLGEPFISRKARCDLKKAPCSTMDCKRDDCSSDDHPMCDSVIGTHRDINTPLLFREFIVYHPDQCYPEFLVEYLREY